MVAEHVLQPFYTLPTEPVGPSGPFRIGSPPNVLKYAVGSPPLVLHVDITSNCVIKGPQILAGVYTRVAVDSVLDGGQVSRSVREGGAFYYYMLFIEEFCV